MSIKKWIPDGLIGLTVTAVFLFIVVTGSFDFTDTVEMKAFDFLARYTASGERNPDIELVVISDDDVREFGRFPWSRDILARGIHNLSLAGAKVIALDIPLAGPEENPGLQAVRLLKETYEAQGLAQEGAGLTFYRKLSEAATDLDNDAKLYKAVTEAGNVVLPVYFNSGTAAGVDGEAPDFILRHSLKRIRGQGQERAATAVIRMSKVEPIFPNFAEAAAGIGHANLFEDDDGYVRTQIHALGYLKDIFFPSLPLAVVQIFRGLKDEDITFLPGRGIQLKTTPSTLRVPVTDPRMRTLIRWNKGPGIAFHQTPFSKIYKNEIQTSLFRDKIVIVGPTARGVDNRMITPLSENLPGVEIMANSVANILDQRFYERPEWDHFLEIGVLILLGFYITFVLPGLKAGTGTAATLGLFVCYGGLVTFLFLSYGTWVKTAAPLLLLVLGHLLIISRRFLVTKRVRESTEADSIETNRMLGLSFQQQGMLDLALEKFNKLPLEEEGVKDLLYNLGLDFERKRQFSKALSTYLLIPQGGMNFRDLSERIPRLRGAETATFFDESAVPPGENGGTLKKTDSGPTLGRYEVIGKLGRGAMGTVYKGLDPKIHRTVAIKTLRLAEFDEDALDEIKERFFREAESAGLLTHPNIVTIYDCGEGHNLAYIAMEYMDGDDLGDYTQPGRLLSVRESLSIVSKVASALDYAHGRGIVHRDIKPANIMRIKETGEVKVTDFGIARITSSSRTKTGLILGTPSYMSPEQIAGKKVDGRSDIFSLGVVLFEMLTGQKPFTGDDMTSLMYNIAREKHPPARTINPKIPPVVEKIIDKALEKHSKKRYQKAGQMAEHLKKVVDRIDEIASRKKGENQTRK